MKKAIKTGLGFGLTSGIITTLGVIVGLSSGTHSEIAIISGVLTVAIADSLSDALGIHVSEESKGNRNHGKIWMATVSASLSKFICAISFIIPVLLFSSSVAVLISIIWGFLLLSFFSYYIARENGENPWRAIAEHLSVATVVVIITHYAGVLINLLF